MSSYSFYSTGTVIDTDTGSYCSADTMVGDSDMEDEGERVEFTKLGDNLEEPADVRNPESDIVQNMREITGAEERAFLARYVRIVSLKKQPGECVLAHILHTDAFLHR